jgi:hypothetical protein
LKGTTPVNNDAQPDGAIIYLLNRAAAIGSAAESHQVALRFEGVARIVHSRVEHRIGILRPTRFR